ncbi:flagellar basal body rod protein FlgB [Comamonas terrigena]|uniref:flagellar basal body rod protein FlgB n=1 Tax=Comamonas terrigena TaxID=32013 RepID=UPI0028A2845D|nr:flagellar basal body rod protein FlgB [Comamonas terrigena]
MENIKFEEAAFLLRTKRMELLASNIANADTPNYHAKDINFRSELEKTQKSTISMESTNQSHLGNLKSSSSLTPTIAFRPVAQDSLDRNTVDLDQERATFSENAIRTQFAMNQAVEEYVEMGKMLSKLI